MGSQISLILVWVLTQAQRTSSRASSEKQLLEIFMVIDLDIKGFFDNLGHDQLQHFVAQATDNPWCKLYIKRWITAGVQMPADEIQQAEKGIPQGGVISPLLANLYLHKVFDSWMQKYFPQNPFERYADDIVCHCRTEREAE